MYLVLKRSLRVSKLPLINIKMFQFISEQREWAQHNNAITSKCAISVRLAGRQIQIALLRFEWIKHAFCSLSFLCTHRFLISWNSPPSPPLPLKTIPLCFWPLLFPVRSPSQPAASSLRPRLGHFPSEGLPGFLWTIVFASHMQRFTFPRGIFWRCLLRVYQAMIRGCLILSFFFEAPATVLDFFFLKTY